MLTSRTFCHGENVCFRATHSHPAMNAGATTWQTFQPCLNLTSKSQLCPVAIFMDSAIDSKLSDLYVKPRLLIRNPDLSAIPLLLKKVLECYKGSWVAWRS